VKLAFLLLLAFPVRAEQSAGGGAATVSVASGDLIYAAAPLQGGINGQIVVRRLAADGGVVWEQTWGRGRSEEATGIATMADGGVVVAGSYKGGCFAVRFDGQGRSVWEAAPVSTGLCHPAGVVTDAESNTYLLAAIDGAAGFDAIVWKLSKNGDSAWNYRYSSNESLYPQNLYLDPRGDRLRAFVLRKHGTEYLEEFFRLDVAGRRL
jgi:outer membrane protein assembly factor BamB